MSSHKPVKPRVSHVRRQRIDYFTAKILLHDVFPSINRNYSDSKDNTLRKPEAVKGVWVLRCMLPPE